MRFVYILFVVAIVSIGAEELFKISWQNEIAQQSKLGPQALAVDANNNIYLLDNFSKKHLGIFEMAGITAIDLDKSKQKFLVEEFISTIKRILIDKLKLDIEKLHVKVCTGGTVKELTQGRYEFNKKIPKDILTYKIWKKLGVPEKNFIWDTTRDSFLSL